MRSNNKENIEKYRKRNGIEPQEHAIAYEHLFSSWLKGLFVKEAKSELERYFSLAAERYADKIPTIELTRRKGIYKILLY